MTVAARQLFKGVRPHHHISTTALEKSLEFKNFRDPPGSGCRVLGFICKRLRAPPRQPGRPQDRKGGKRVSQERGGWGGGVGVGGGGGAGGRRPDPGLLVPDASRQEAEANRNCIGFVWEFCRVLGGFNSVGALQWGAVFCCPCLVRRCPPLRHCRVATAKFGVA